MNQPFWSLNLYRFSVYYLCSGTVKSVILTIKYNLSLHLSTIVTYARLLII